MTAMLNLPSYVDTLAGFDDTDWRRYTHRGDGRTEHAAAIAVDDASADHTRGLHDLGQHPYCWRCQYRADCWNVAAQTSAWHLLDEPASEVEEILARDAAAARARRGLLRDRRLTPPPAPRVADDDVYPFLTLSELRALASPSYLIDGLVPRGGYGLITGRDGVWKSFAALSMCLALVTEELWNDRAITYRTGRVIYMAGEGASGFPHRVEAWLEHHGLEELTSEQEDSLTFRNGTPDLFAGGRAYEQLLEVCRAQQPDLIVNDTLQRSAGAADQDKARDMRVVTERLAALKDASGPHCTVITVAHTTKGDDDSRGSSSIEDDADFVLHMKKTDNDRVRLTVRKMKDGPGDLQVDLQVQPVANSLVLVGARPEPQWASDDLTSRVVGVLFAVRDGDDPTATQLLSMVREDGTGKPCSKTTLNTLLGELRRSGAVTAHKTGKGAAAPLHYRLDPSRYPPDVKS